MKIKKILFIHFKKITQLIVSFKVIKGLIKSLIFHFPGGSDIKESAYNEGYPGLISGLGRSPREGNGKPLQYPCLENSMHREAWQATIHTVHGVKKSQPQLTD